MLLSMATMASAQVSYMEMQTERAKHNTYRHPATLTPVAGTDKYMEIEDNNVVLYDYNKEGAGEVIFKTKKPIISYDKSPDGMLALYEIFDGSWPRKEIYRHSYTSTYYVTCPNGSTARIDDVRDITFAPNSKMVAMSYDNNIFVYDLVTNEMFSITDDGRWNEIINGTTDWVYEEEYGFTQAYAFSPDSREIAYLKFDESRVPEFEMMRFDNKALQQGISLQVPQGRRHQLGCHTPRLQHRD